MIELVSDIGGGKTTFVGGLARGMGSSDHVSSPTFTINNVYKSDALTMHHFDFYRLFEPGIMRDELAEVMNDPKSVTVIEWANIVNEVLPDSKLTIRILATGEASREYEFTASSELVYLIEGVSAC